MSKVFFFFFGNHITESYNSKQKSENVMPVDYNIKGLDIEIKKK